MSLLILGLALFFAIHALPWLPPLRRRLIERLGALPYRGLFALVSALGLLLIVLGHARAPHEPLWLPPAWGRPLVYPLLFAAFVLLAAAYLPGNLKRYTRHPMLWGVVLWGVGHLLVRGDLSSLLLFGGFIGYALLAMASANLRGARKTEQRQPLWKDALVLVAGAAAYAGFALAHPWLIGVAVLP
ncbi:NnrU family protein [Rehaibacterium terrae]|jgi:uncharacterized membrane protein|uniref:Putative membrane protein n=1 Tax=Rehaibacterium terrae TaxID=1341696 RepID=A0A7W7Y0H9_9GAMM|nr:NnrU family protein [Rehaibacterium terrae]MBB5015849.1 putative membrane protein [Rehaibacterium terrae]